MIGVGFSCWSFSSQTHCSAVRTLVTVFALYWNVLAFNLNNMGQCRCISAILATACHMMCYWHAWPACCPVSEYQKITLPSARGPCVFQNQRWLFRHYAHLLLFFPLRQSARDALSIFAAKCEQSVVTSESSIFELFVEFALKKKIGLLTQYDSGQFRFVLLETVLSDLEHSLCSHRSFVWNMQLIDFCFFAGSWHVCMRVQASVPVTAITVCRPICMFAHPCVL